MNPIDGFGSGAIVRENQETLSSICFVVLKMFTTLTLNALKYWGISVGRMDIRQVSACSKCDSGQMTAGCLRLQCSF